MKILDSHVIFLNIFLYDSIPNAPLVLSKPESFANKNGQHKQIKVPFLVHRMA